MNVTGDTLLVLVDVAIAFIAVEALLLALLAHQGRGPPPRAWALGLVAGTWLMLALRFALAGSGWPVWSACLAAAGVAHVGDLAWRWRADPRN